MKSTCLLLLLLGQAFTHAGMARQSKPIVPDQIKLLNPGKIYLNAIHSRAVRDFLCKYENATDVAWFNVNNGFIVRFTTDSVSARSAYKKQGHWVYTIKTYMEAKMPRPVRHIIKTTWYDYEITLVEQIELPNEPVRYIVHLEDAVSFKNVLVFDGQAEMIEDKKKL